MVFLRYLLLAQKIIGYPCLLLMPPLYKFALIITFSNTIVKCCWAIK